METRTKKRTTSEYKKKKTVSNTLQNGLENKYKLDRNFFNMSCYELANSLLGKLLVRKFSDGTIGKARIVETECYLGGEDKASNTFGGRRTEANEPLYMEAGTAFVYMTYGMYHCFNISSTEPGAGVLIRALDPIEGVQKMIHFRSQGSKWKIFQNDAKLYLPKQLCSGPSKLCMSLDITKSKINKVNICDSRDLWLETDPKFNEEIKIVKTSRIGIDSVGGEWAKKLLRFYIFGNESVSKRDKKAEEDYTLS